MKQFFRGFEDQWQPFTGQQLRRFFSHADKFEGKMLCSELHKKGTAENEIELIYLPSGNQSDAESDEDFDEDDIPLADLLDSGDDDDAIQNSTDDSADDEPLISFKKIAQVEASNASAKPNKVPKISKRKPSHNFRWVNRNPPVLNQTFKGKFSDPPEEPLSPINYFKKFFSDEMFENISNQTNLYSVQQTGSSINTNKGEIEQFIGILMLMGIFHFPEMRMYWNNKWRYSPIADIMPENRFSKLRQFFHLNDNLENHEPEKRPGTDKLFKVRPLLDALRQNCLKVEKEEGSEERHSIDEQMIPYKGKHSGMRQYCPKKPVKWGFKVFTRNGVSGITYDFDFYVGSKKPIVEASHDAEAESFGCGGDVVLKLCETLNHQNGHKLYIDNYFTSLELLIKLKAQGILAIGTLRADRMRDCVLEPEKTLKKKGRGSFNFKVDGNSGLCVLEWYDNKVVRVVSSYCGATPVSNVQRWSKKENKYVSVPRPFMILEYNQNMGGVDKFDMLMAFYRIDRRNKKYYMRIVYWALQLPCINGWLLYKRHMCLKSNDVSQEKTAEQRKNTLPLIEFILSIAESLLKVNKVLSRKRGRPSGSPQMLGAPQRQQHPACVAPQGDIRKDRLDHWPTSGKKNRCRNCEDKRLKDKSIKEAKSRIWCTKCNVSLCLTNEKNCFRDYHL